MKARNKEAFDTLLQASKNFGEWSEDMLEFFKKTTSSTGDFPMTSAKEFITIKNFATAIKNGEYIIVNTNALRGEL